MVATEKIKKAIEILRNASHPRKIILFGSYARGDANEESDLDFLIIKAQVKDRLQEMVELRRLISPLRLPVDIIVVSEDTFKEWASTPGNVYFEAAQEGKVVYESVA